ncbi:MAG TPA: hypothetical protein PKZ42_10375 [Syntrophales bacterium]|nr:hypothetical protein [Syntrophales bacterium]
MTGYFERASIKFKNSQSFVVNHQKISDFEPIRDVRKRVFLIFNMLRDAEDDNSRKINLQAWKLLTTIELSILPFDHKDLLLSEQLDALETEIAYFPAIKEAYQQLRNIVEWLRSNPNNPKREALHIKLKGCPQNKKIGVITRLTKWGKIAGWGGDTCRELSCMYEDCEFLNSASDFKANFYECIILPSAGGMCPLMKQIFSTYVSKEVFLIYYDREKRNLPEKKCPPPGSFGMKDSKDKNVLPLTPATDETWSVDDWIDITYWQRMREEFTKSEAGTNSNSGSEILVRARLVMLGDFKTAVLREDHRIIEISDLIEGHSNIEEFGKKFPRKLVKELKLGDLIVMRTSGSGDILDEVAKELMKREGQTALLTTALDWKIHLKQAFQDYSDGTLLIAEKLKNMGHLIRDPNYMWMWTTAYVIRPESKDLFFDLILVLHELDCDLPIADPLKYAQEKWSQMSVLLKYRMKAGRKIRELLLSRLRQVIERDDVIGNEYHLNLVGADGGELTIFRVSGIDSEQMSVPYSRTGVICEMKDQKWLD